MDEISDAWAVFNPPRISIVIPAYNCASFLGETLESVSRQTLREWECLIVDDGSTDETGKVARDWAARDPRMRLLSTANGGPARARNRGFLNMNPASEFVSFMDADDVWLPQALETLVGAVEADPTAAGAHGLAEMIDATGRIVGPGSYPDRGRKRLGIEGRRLVVWPLERPTDFAVLVNGNVLFPPGLVLSRRSVYEKVGGFDARFHGPEDWDMLIRLSRHGHLVFRDAVILHYRMHGGNLGSQPWVARQAWLVRCKAFHSPENTPAQREVARRGWRAYQLMMVRERLGDARRSWRRRNIGKAADALARAAVHLIRAARGHPRPKLVIAGQPWDSAPGDTIARPPHKRRRR